jgi:hypothetical protein
MSASPAVDENFRRKQIFIFHYTHPLSPRHPKVAYLQQTLDLLGDMGIACLAYITPINYQAGERVVGEAFTKIVRANVGTLSNELESYHQQKWFRFIDYSYHLSSNYFFHINEPTEHLAQFGRVALAGLIAKEVMALHGL